MKLVKNPLWPGVENSPKPKVDEVQLSFIDTDPAFSSYEAGTMDYIGVPLAQMDRVKADPVLSKELFIGPSGGTYYYGFNVTKAPFDNVHARRAFSLAVDRQSLIDNVTKGGQEPARWFARPGIAAAPTMKDSPELGIFNAADAKKEWGLYLADAKITADQVPPITLVVNDVEGHIKIGQAIQDMWVKNLGVKVELTKQEWKVFLKALETDSPQIWRLGWNQDYADANNFLREVFHSTSSQNYTKWEQGFR
jgi:oligopeptide transport system substrate-binding protein